VDLRDTAVEMHETDQQYDIIQQFQNKVLKNIVDAHWYIRNAGLQRDLQMEIITNETGKFAKKNEERPLQLFDNSELVRRLIGRKPFELE
jgi:hypothetical protein